jgi:DNA polymerase (family X)
VGRQTVACTYVYSRQCWTGTHCSCPRRSSWRGTAVSQRVTRSRRLAKALPRNADVAEQLELLADLLELEGAASFRIVAYRRAAQRIRETAGSVAELALAGRAKELSGIGKTIEEKIVQVVEDGEMHALTKRKGIVPPEVVLFMRLPGLGPKTAARIWKELGVTTIEELKRAAEAEQIRTLSGLGAKSEERILKALAEKKQEPSDRRLLGDGLGALLAVVSLLRDHPAAVEVSEAGSARRRKETFRDLDIIATAKDPAALVDYFTKLKWVVEVAAKGPTKATVLSNEGLRFDLRVVPPESYGNLLQHFTGSKDHNLALRERAVKDGLSVSEYSITVVETGKELRYTTERGVYERLGYQYIPPELRENAGELEAARKGELPKLVELKDIRGDLHCHSTWSDGKHTLEQMARAARERGYEYLAITDHPRGTLAEQDVEVETLNERLAPLRILRGIEVNIRVDGSLSLPDEVLAERDWVIASLHGAFDRNPTERVLAAMDNPHVDLIGHLTARKINIRQPADVNVERVVEKAVETGTFLEINSQPNRLDLRDTHARLAGEAGIKVLVSTDAHELRALGHIEMGVAQARRAWLTKDQVLNTRSWTQIQKLLK